MIYEYVRENFFHTDEFDGIVYTDVLSMVQISFAVGRSDEFMKALIADLNRRFVEIAGVRSDEVFIAFTVLPLLRTSSCSASPSARPMSTRSQPSIRMGEPARTRMSSTGP